MNITISGDSGMRRCSAATNYVSRYTFIGLWEFLMMLCMWSCYELYSWIVSLLYAVLLKWNLHMPLTYIKGAVQWVLVCSEFRQSTQLSKKKKKTNKKKPLQNHACKYEEIIVEGFMSSSKVVLYKAYCG